MSNQENKKRKFEGQDSANPAPEIQPEDEDEKSEYYVCDFVTV